MFITDYLIHLYRQNRFARAVKSKLCMTSKVSGDIMNKVGNASPWARHEHAPLMIGGWLSSTRSQSAKSHPVHGQTKNQFCHCVICIHLRYFGKRACLKPTTCTMRSDAQQCAAMHGTLDTVLLHSFAPFYNIWGTFSLSNPSDVASILSNYTTFSTTRSSLHTLPLANVVQLQSSSPGSPSPGGSHLKHLELQNAG